MRISVVINTFNRARSLEQTLRALPKQTWRPFEVVVVNGPSTDETSALLQRWEGVVRTVRCPERHLGISRNIGIEAAAGDVVAFIDDDAIPEPEWLSELAAGYDADQVAGVGGIVFDHTGMRLQYEFSLCDRVGDPRFDMRPPLSTYMRPGADPFVYLQGTNASFRRRCLEEIGGFDEEIEFYLDETEVCLQLTDRGYQLRPLPNAAVHHHYLPSHLRLNRRVWVDPYPAVKNRLYFALSHGVPGRGHGEVLRTVMTWLEDVKSAARRLHESGELTDDQLAAFLSRAEQGVTDGLVRGFAAQRKSRTLAAAVPEAFQPMPPPQLQGQRLRVCFLSEDYPPGPVGGIGRFTFDLATGLAAAGHDVHVVTRSPDTNRVDVEDDVWVHRIAVQQRRVPGLEGSVLAGSLLHHAALYHEVRRLHQRLNLSVVSAPAWNAQALLSLLDPSFPTITSLHTTLATISKVLPSWQGQADVEALLRLEAAMFRESRELHANSRAALALTEEQFPQVTARAHVLPHGLADRARPGIEPMAKEDRIRVVFVGRLERRKGVDLLLAAAPELLARHADAEVVLVGSESPHTELGETYREWFRRQHAADPALLERVRFVGEVDDDERDRWYASADVFCAPSRYESFGLVLLEAMSFGLPVVSCDVGGVGEIVDGNGLLAEPEDVGSLTSCLDQLLSDPEMRRDMGRRSRELFEKNWGLVPWVERVSAAYRRVAAEHPRAKGSVDAERLASILVEVGATAPEQAAGAARDLLDPAAYPIDAASTLVDLLLADDETFVRGCYQLLLGRDPEKTGVGEALERLQNGMSRLDYVETMATSDEARYRRVDLNWLPRARFLWERVLVGALEDLFEKPDPEFCDGVYRLLLLRQPDPRGRRDLLGFLARGGDRREALRTIALSAEARERWVPEDLAERVAPPPEHPADAGARPLRVARRATNALRRARRAAAFLDQAGAGVPSKVEQELIQSLKALAEAVRDVGRTNATITAAVDRLADELPRSIASLASAQRDQAAAVDQWLDVLGRKQEAMALELRERLPPVAETADLPEPVVVDPPRLRALLESGEAVRVNLGCGEKPLPGYVNVDARPLPDVDVVADARRLPFEPATVDEVVSHHLVEHFRRHHLSSVVLPYWLEILRPGGVATIVCPNWEAMIRLAAQGEMPIADLAHVTFGMQDYQGDDHFAMYSPETLTQVLVDVGFEPVEVVTAERRNGLSIEMELSARKPATGS